MNKQTFVNKFGEKAAVMVSTAEFQAMMATARAGNPFLAMGKQELEVLQLSGAAIGWHKCLEWLETAHVLPPVRPEKPTVGNYQDPDKISQENKKP